MRNLESLHRGGIDLHGTSSSRYSSISSKGLTPEFSACGNKLYTLHIGQTPRVDEIPDLINFVWRYAYENTFWVPEYSQFHNPNAFPIIVVLKPTPKLSVLGVDLLKDKGIDEKETKKVIKRKRILGAVRLSSENYESKRISDEDALELWTQILKIAS